MLTEELIMQRAGESSARVRKETEPKGEDNDTTTARRPVRATKDASAL